MWGGGYSPCSSPGSAVPVVVVLGNTGSCHIRRTGNESGLECKYVYRTHGLLLKGCWVVLIRVPKMNCVLQIWHFSQKLGHYSKQDVLWYYSKTQYLLFYILLQNCIYVVYDPILPVARATTCLVLNCYKGLRSHAISNLVLKTLKKISSKLKMSLFLQKMLIFQDTADRYRHRQTDRQ